MAHSVLSDRDFAHLSRLITSTCGIRMPENKRTMLQGRLQKRLRQLNMDSLGDYCDYLLSDEGLKDEFANMIDVVTTNKTDFFREPAHFGYLVDTAIPELIDRRGAGIERPLALWSAGCSTGEEPYTIAMLLEEFAGKTAGFRYGILATDVSTRVLDAARAAIYRSEKAMQIPYELKKRYLLKSRERERGLVRVIPGLRKRVRFQRLNLAGDFTVAGRMDIIFIRNVLIYFNREVQERLLARLCRFLGPDGYLFVGHSESLHGMDLPLRQVAPSTYVREPSVR